MKILELQEDIVIKQTDKKIILEKGDKIKIFEDDEAFYSEPKSIEEPLEFPETDESGEVSPEEQIVTVNQWDETLVSNYLADLSTANEALSRMESGVLFQKNLRSATNAVQNLYNYITTFIKE